MHAIWAGGGCVALRVATPTECINTQIIQAAATIHHTMAPYSPRWRNSSAAWELRSNSSIPAQKGPHRRAACTGHPRVAGGRLPGEEIIPIPVHLPRKALKGSCDA
jgi:hypothetical protein